MVMIIVFTGIVMSGYAMITRVSDVGEGEEEQSKMLRGEVVVSQ